MAFYGYDIPYRAVGRYRAARERAYGRRYGRDYEQAAADPYDRTFGDARIAADYPRMGMHDFTEHYGRYSGGPPDDYEYSERTVLHAHPPYDGGIGFTRPLRGRPRRATRYGGEYRRSRGAPRDYW